MATSPSASSPSPQATAKTAAIRNPMFRDSVLGIWSSHPYCQRERLKKLSKFSAAVIVIAITIPGLLFAPFAILLAPVLVVLSACLSSFFAVMTKTIADSTAMSDKQLLERQPSLSLDDVLGTAKPKESSEEEKPDTGEDTPEWIKKLLEEKHLLPPEAYSVVPVDTSSKDFSDPDQGSDVALLFGGRPPTEDQAKALDFFASSYDSRLASFWGDEEKHPMMDMLVEGDTGTGKSGLLSACAILAVLGRGQHVLYLIPSDRAAEKKEKFKQKIGGVLKNVYLENNIACDFLNPKNLELWLEENGKTPLPDILIATLADAEKLLYGASGTGDMHERLKRLLLLFEVVLVDDFMAFEEISKSHLPFFIDKHRLVLESEQAPLQLVVSTLPLSKSGRILLGQRLFTQKGFNEERQAFHLRPPRPKGRIWQVELSIAAENPGPEMEGIAKDCCEEGRNVVLLRTGMDRKGCASVLGELQKELKPADAARLQVVAELDDLPETADVDAVFYQMAMIKEGIAITSLQLQDKEWVLFKVLGKDEDADEMEERSRFGLVPLIFDRTAMAMRDAHLASALRFIHPWTPIPIAAWHQFGLNRGGTASPARCGNEVPPNEFELARLLLDEPLPPNPAADNPLLGNSPGAVWPYLVMKSDIDSRAMPINVHEIVSHFGTIECLEGGGFVVRKDRQPESKVPGRQAIWIEDEDEIIPLIDAKVDLAYLKEFKVSCDSGVFVPKTIFKKEGGQEIFLKSIRWRGRGDDLYLPVWDVAWDLGSGKELLANDSGGGEDWGMRWCQIADAELKEWPGRMTLRGRTTDYGKESPEANSKNLWFDYGVLLSLIQMGASAKGAGSLDDQACLDLIAAQGHWETDEASNPSVPMFSPELTGAFNYALSVRMPDFTFYCRFLVFLLPDEIAGKPTPCKAIAWIVEPATGARAAMKGLEKILVAESDEFVHVLELAQRFLGRLAAAPESSRVGLIRKHARSGYDGDRGVLRNLRIAEARGVIEEMLEKCKR